jgi:hypothetical protein
LQKSSPPGFGYGSSACSHASIDAAALEADSSDDDDNDDEYSFFGKLPKPYPKNLSLRKIDGCFMLLFVDSRKCQEIYSKTRKVKVFYKVLTMEKKDILAMPHPPEQCKRGLTFGRSKGSGHSIPLLSCFT